MCGSVVYRCVEICCCYGGASVWCKELAGGIILLLSAYIHLNGDYSKIFLTPCDYSLWGVLKDKVFAPSPCNLAELQAAIETESETIRATLDFASCVCHILCNHSLACIAETVRNSNIVTFCSHYKLVNYIFL